MRRDNSFIDDLFLVGILDSVLRQDSSLEKEILEENRKIRYELEKKSKAQAESKKKEKAVNSYKSLIDEYIEERSEEEIVELINTHYKDNHYLMEDIADELFELKFFQAAEAAYKVVIRNQDSVSFSWPVSKAYIRIGDHRGLMAWKRKLESQNHSTWRIDRYLKDQDPEELSARIISLENQEDWQSVIDHVNKYSKLILEHPWKKMDERIEFEFKKIRAYGELGKYKQAWNSACKTRMILLSNFNGLDFFNYLSRIEGVMKELALKEDYLVDAGYHYLMEIVYRDLYEHYYSHLGIYFSITEDQKLMKILKKSNLVGIIEKIELAINREYEIITEKTIRNINSLIRKILDEEGYKFNLEEPKKYFPKLVARDFPIDLNKGKEIICEGI